MYRLLLIESSPTLRRGRESLLFQHGFDVVSVDANQSALADIDRALARGLSGVLIGWTTTSPDVCQLLMRRLAKPDCGKLGLVVLISDSDPVDDSMFDERPFTVAHRGQGDEDMPRVTRALLAQIARDTHQSAEQRSGLKVLLVDDSRTSRVKYQRLLQSHGYVVVTCEHAEAALSMASTDRFDLVIVDYYMPGMNGAMLCRALRELPATREVTLAVLTGAYEDGLISSCIEAGASECMFKNESNELFLARVHGMARLRERELRLVGERARVELILSSVGDGVYGVDREGRVTFVNPAALRLLQWSGASDLVGFLAHDYIHFADERGRKIPAETSFLHQAYELGDSLSDWETVFWRSDGKAVNVECTVRPQHHEGECVGVVVAFRDIAERKRFEAELQWQVHHDHLTKLVNRQYFEDLLEQELLRLKRSSERSALLFIDLDRFKQINDSAGHAAGDALLSRIGQNLKSRSRQSDLVARLGGDEFAVLLRNVDDESVVALAEKFRAILEVTQFVYQGREFEVSGSIGVSNLNRHTPSPAYAMNCADAACQIAKRRGRNQIHMFDINDAAGMMGRFEISLSERLHQALARSAFGLQFQPILDLRRLPADAIQGDDWLERAMAVPSAIYGYEVFIRLDDGDTRIAACAFLPQAERFELLTALDTWVLNRLAALVAAREPAEKVCFHVNVASASLLDSGYRLRLANLLSDGAFAPGSFRLELRDSDALTQLAPVLPMLAELTQLGLKLILDEYGRGFGGLGRLRSLPFAAVKLDAALVQTLARDQLGETLVRAMADLAHSMDMLVVAPMVEDAETLRRLRDAGADFAQGFVIGGPEDDWRVPAKS